MESELKLPDTHNADAAVWAKSFCEHFPEFDEATAIGWFANAMMAMHDHLMQTHEWNTRPTASNELVDELRKPLPIYAMDRLQLIADGAGFDDVYGAVWPHEHGIVRRDLKAILTALKSMETSNAK